MKVKIGPYLNWWGPYQFADLLQKVGVSEDTCYEIGQWIDEKTILGDICEWVYSKRKRTIKVHIDKYDTWGMDSTLAHIILPMLKQLKATKHGAPGSMPAFDQTSNSGQGSFDFYAERDDAAWEIGHMQWNEIMDKMIFSFQEIVDDKWEEQYCSEAAELDMKDYPEDEGKASTPLRWVTKGKYDWEGMRAHGERIQEGIELFGKYYQHLWD